MTMPPFSAGIRSKFSGRTPTQVGARARKVFDTVATQQATRGLQRELQKANHCKSVVISLFWLGNRRSATPVQEQQLLAEMWNSMPKKLANVAKNIPNAEIPANYLKASGTTDARTPMGEVQSVTPADSGFSVEIRDSSGELFTFNMNRSPEIGSMVRYSRLPYGGELVKLLDALEAQIAKTESQCKTLGIPLVQIGPDLRTRVMNRLSGR